MPTGCFKKKRRQGRKEGDELMVKAKRKRGRDRTTIVHKIVVKSPHGNKGIHPKDPEKRKIDLKGEK